MSETGLGLGTQTTADPQEVYRTQVTLAKAGIKRGASWFDWIAIFSIVNAVIVLANGNWHFLLGLGITDIVNYLRCAAAATAARWRVWLSPGWQQPSFGLWATSPNRDSAGR